MIALPRRFESVGFVPAAPEAVFGYVDDHERLSSHMTRSSWMLGGGRMDVQLDAGRGRWLIAKVASWYASWCTRRMGKTPSTIFAATPAATASLTAKAP